MQLVSEMFSAFDSCAEVNEVAKVVRAGTTRTAVYAISFCLHIAR